MNNLFTFKNFINICKLGQEHKYYVWKAKKDIEAILHVNKEDPLMTREYVVREYIRLNPHMKRMLKKY